MKYEPCVHCGEEIGLWFTDTGAEVWLHAKSAMRTCGNLLTRAESCPKPDPAPLVLPEPSPDGDTAEDDLIGTVGQLDEMLKEANFALDELAMLCEHLLDYHNAAGSPASIIAWPNEGRYGNTDTRRRAVDAMESLHALWKGEATSLKQRLYARAHMAGRA